MKLPSFIKAILIFSFILLSIYILYSKGIINNHLHLFNPGYRLTDLSQCTKGLELSHQYLLLYSKGETPNYCPAENLGDDMGIYLFIPLIQHFFNTDTYLAYLGFFCSIVLLGYSLAAIGFGLLFQDDRIKFFSYFFLALISFISLFILDVYILAYLVTSLIPLLYWIWKKYEAKHIGILYPIIALLATGLLASIASTFRVYSGIGILLMVALFILLEKKITILRKFLFIGALFITLPLCKLFTDRQINQRDKWLVTTGNYTLNNKLTNHPIWHNMYLGLGILPNKYGISWSDTIAFNKEKQFNADRHHLSPQYLNAIKNDYLDIIKNDLPFVLKTIAYKCFLVLLMCIIFFNYGLFLMRRIKFSYKLYLPLFAGIGFYVLPGILTYPLPHYIFGALNILAICLLFLINEVYSSTKSS